MKNLDPADCFSSSNFWKVAKWNQYCIFLRTIIIYYRRSLHIVKLSYFYFSQGAQGSPFKLTIGESIDRIKEEFNFLQAQYNRSVHM